MAPWAAKHQRDFFNYSYNTQRTKARGLYYKPIRIINDDSRVLNKLETLLTDDTRVIIYDCHMFIVQATGLEYFNLKTFELYLADF